MLRGKVHFKSEAEIREIFNKYGWQKRGRIWTFANKESGYREVAKYTEWHKDPATEVEKLFFKEFNEENEIPLDRIGICPALYAQLEDSKDGDPKYSVGQVAQVLSWNEKHGIDFQIIDVFRFENETKTFIELYPCKPLIRIGNLKNEYDYFALNDVRQTEEQLCIEAESILKRHNMGFFKNILITKNNYQRIKDAYTYKRKDGGATGPHRTNYGKR